MVDVAEESLAEVRKTFRSGKTRSVAWRKNQLRALKQLINDNEDKVSKALYDDLWKHPTEVYRDEVIKLVYLCVVVLIWIVRVKNLP